MYSIIKTSHSHFAWIALIALFIVVIISGIAFFNKKNLTTAQLKITLMGMIAAHIQLQVGLVLYFISPYGVENLSGATMKDSFARLLAVEHPFVNIIALILITIGYSKGKNAFQSNSSAKPIFVYFGLGLILILSRIPWQVWLN